MIETSFKNWLVQKRQLYILRNEARRTYLDRGTYYGKYSMSVHSAVRHQTTQEETSHYRINLGAAK